LFVLRDASKTVLCIAELDQHINDISRVTNRCCWLLIYWQNMLSCCKHMWTM